MPLSLGVMLIAPVHASDVWDYARERSQRNEQPVAITESERVIAKPLQKNVKPEVKILKRPTRSVNKASSTKIKSSVVDEPTDIKPVSMAPSLHKFDAEAVSFGNWLKKVIDAIKATPSEEQLQTKYRAIKQENAVLKENLAKKDTKLELQQNNLQLVQRKLKEVQHPSLPVDISRREVFAAGMASGYSLLELIERRKSLGIELNSDDFLAGVTEAVKNGKRLPSAEFQSLLSSMNKKVEGAEHLYKREREERDGVWLSSFQSEAGVLKNKNGIWYQVKYKGDRAIKDGETFFVSLGRKLSTGEIIFDSDINDEYIEMRLNNVPVVLSDILTSINLHGEAIVAMPVDAYGKPDVASKFFEQWTLRIVDAGDLNPSASF